MSKKIFIISLIAAMTFALSGCGTTEETEVSTTNNTFNSSSEESVLVETEETEGTEKEEETQKEVEPLQEILEADLSSNKVQLGDYVVKFPVTVQELIDAGVGVIEPNPNTTVVGTGIGYNVYLNFGSRTYALEGRNFTGAEALLKDCTFYDTECWSENDKDYYLDVDLIYPKGMKAGVTVDELKAAWGEPTESSLQYLTYECDQSSYYGKIDLETNTISEIGFVVQIN